MVKLEITSTFDAKKEPFLREWDFDMRKNYAQYQADIDKLTYHLQRSQRGLLILGQLFYPRNFQKDILALEVYRAKQLVGTINQDEVNQYKRIDPEVSDALNRTFSASLPWPVRGATIGAGLFAFGQVFNYQYSFRAAFLFAPIVVDVFLQLGDKSSYFKSLEFLNWLTQYRTAKARIERDGSRLDQSLLSKYKSTFKAAEPVETTYNQFVDLVIKEAHSE